MKLICKTYSCEHPRLPFGASIVTGDCLILSAGISGPRGHRIRGRGVMLGLARA